MKPRIPYPNSGGFILSYKCTAGCRHCMYACDPRWKGDWPSEKELEVILTRLVPYIKGSPYGKSFVSLNYGLHFTGGEPFLNFELLLKATRIASKLEIPSLFVETNAFWCHDDKITREYLIELRNSGMNGILISVNPFYLEYVPFERTERCVNISYEVFGDNMMVYQGQYFKLFQKLGIRGRIGFDEYFEKVEKVENMLYNTEFFFMGRAPYGVGIPFDDYFKRYQTGELIKQPCRPQFLRPWHNHFDNYGNYIPGYCGGLSFGNIIKDENLFGKVIDGDEFPVLYSIATNDFASLLELAIDYGYRVDPGGYFSKCHLCVDIRRHLAVTGNFKELEPQDFYSHLD